MVRAWHILQEETDDPRDALYSDESVSIEELAQVGVEYFKFDADTFEQNDDYLKLKNDRGYSYGDTISVSRATLPNFDAKIKSFFEEHLHTDDEIRFILEGSGYFDVRDFDGRWIRIECVKGDLLVLPAGIYHRFTLDKKDYIKALRLFIGVPVWTPHNKPADSMKERLDYVSKYLTATTAN
ncbi:LOW QUALITY PROTEIN: acireductone dioxygenase [Ciona intestinalis]